MELEVVSRLLRLDNKLDQLAYRLHTGADDTAGRARAEGGASSSARPLGVAPHEEPYESSWRKKAVPSAVWNLDPGHSSNRSMDSSLPLPEGDVLVDMVDVPFWEPAEVPKRVTSARRGDNRQEEAACPSNSSTADTTVPQKATSDGLGDEGARKLVLPELQLPQEDHAADSVQSSPGDGPAGRVRRHSVASDASTMLEKRRTRSFFRDPLWKFLDDPESSMIAGWYAAIMPIFTIFSVGFALVQTVEPPLMPEKATMLIEAVIELIFAIELCIRFFSCPNQRNFIFDWHNVIDAIAIAPLFIRVAFRFEMPRGRIGGLEDGVNCVLLSTVPVLRVLKTIRRFERFQLLISAFELCVEALPICLFSLLVLTLVFAALIYLVEPRDNIASLPQAMWLTIVTMTTVGYGDITPVSGAGSCIVAVLVITSVLYMAMPLGIIGQAFTQVWSERDRILLVQRTKSRLQQWGYKAHDIPALFQWFDHDQDGELNLAEFSQMISEMRIGLREQRVVELFSSFDNDGSGSIDDREFVKALFPAAYDHIYGDDQPDEEGEEEQVKVTTADG